MSQNPLVNFGSTDAEIIQQEIQKYDLPEAKIAEIKAVCDAVSIAGPNDVEGYKTVSAYLTKVRKYRTGIEAKRKELKELPLKLGKAIDAEAKRLTALVQPIEDRLAAMKAEVDAEQERQRQAEIQRKKDALMNAGFVFDGFGFKCGMLVIYGQQLDTMTDAELAEWCGRATQEMLRIEAQRKAEEAQRAAEQKAVAEGYLPAGSSTQSGARMVPEPNAPAPLFDDNGAPTDPQATTGPWTPPAPVKMVFDGGEIRPADIPANGNPVQQPATAPAFRPAVNGGELTAQDYANEGTRAGFEQFRRRLFEFLDTAPAMTRGEMKAIIQGWKVND